MNAANPSIFTEWSTTILHTSNSTTSLSTAGHSRRGYQMVLVVCVALSLLAATGCVQRRLLVTSQPEGALVTVDHQPIGHTPVAVPFTYYGTREVQVEKDGYQSIKVKHRIAPPWYQLPPLDFISDNFWPREIRDDRVLDFPEMKPLATINENNLLDRANQLRGNVQRGTVPMPVAVNTETDPVNPTVQLPVLPIRSR